MNKLEATQAAVDALPDINISGLKQTPDGSSTFWSSRYGQHYHNRNGALSQARHVFLEGSQTHVHPSPQVLEIGFGLGLNFLTTLADATQRSAPLHYLAYEFDPQASEVLRAIGDRHPAGRNPLWLQLLDHWPKTSALSTLSLNNGQCVVEIRFVDASQASLPKNWASAIYLDGFSPKTNPELWSPTFLNQLIDSLQSSGWITTYSAAGFIRRVLKQARLQVARSPGVAGKLEFLRAQRTN